MSNSSFNNNSSYNSFKRKSKTNSLNNNTPKKLDSYLTFCENLWDSYQLKHQEVISYSSILDELAKESEKLVPITKKYNILIDLLKSKNLKSENSKLDSLKKAQNEMTLKGKKDFNKISSNIQRLVGNYQSLHKNSTKKLNKKSMPQIDNNNNKNSINLNSNRSNSNNSSSKKSRKVKKSLTPKKRSLNLKEQMLGRMDVIKRTIERKELRSKKTKKSISPNQAQTLILERYYNKYMKEIDNEGFDKKAAEEVKEYIDFLKKRNKLLKNSRS